MKSSALTLSRQILQSVIVQFVLLIVLLPLVLYFGVDDIVSEGRQNDIERAKHAEEDYLESYLITRQALLDNYSKIPLFTQTVMQPDNNNALASDMLQGLTFFGEKQCMVLYSFLGDIISSDCDSTFSFPDLKQEISTFVKSGESKKVFVIEDHETFFWVLICAIKYNNYSEGALVTLLPAKDYEKFRHEHVLFDGLKVTISKDGRTITEYGECESGDEYIDSYAPVGVDFAFLFDRTVYEQKRKTLLFNILILIVLISSATLFFMYKNTRKSILVPINELTHRLNDFSNGISNKPAKESNIEEISMLTTAFEVMSRKISSREEKLEKARLELKERNEDLKRNQNQLIESEKMASIGQLAAGVAHEINNPIGFVISNSVTLEEYMEDILTLLKAYESNSTSKEIEKIKKSIHYEDLIEDLSVLLTDNHEGLERVAQIVKNLKSFAHNDPSHEFVEEDINRMLQETLLVARNEIKYVATVEEHYVDLPRISIIRGEINQVFLNILVNAAQAIKTEGSKEQSGKITITTELSDSDVIIKIGDNGPGIAVEHRDKIFDPFYTTKPVGEGTGLGLSISYDIVVRKHGGRLEIDSSPETGTTFIISLPLTRES